MFDLATIKRINNDAVRKHEDQITRKKFLRKRLKGITTAKWRAKASLDQLENAAYYLL